MCHDSRQVPVDRQVAVVTGAGRGIGAATAVAFAEAGADVVIAARTETQLREIAGKVADSGRRAHVVTVDLADPNAAAALPDEATRAFGRLDIVVNNVGGTYPRPLLDTSTDFLEEAFRFNVSTAHALTRAAAPAMLTGGGGAIVNISSMMGRTAGRGFVAYGTAKAALAHYTRLTAADLSPRIRVDAISIDRDIGLGGRDAPGRFQAHVARRVRGCVDPHVRVLGGAE